MVDDAAWSKVDILEFLSSNPLFPYQSWRSWLAGKESATIAEAYDFSQFSVNCYLVQVTTSVEQGIAWWSIERFSRDFSMGAGEAEDGWPELFVSAPSCAILPVGHKDIAVDNRQSGPRPEPRLLHQASLEALTNSARTDSPRRVCRKRISGDNGRQRRRRMAAACVERRGGG
ncbi:vacuolar protein sorting-associated protein 27 [Dorcoceras hygrometricum]|uniref:Vacuolar protein sorting-associated protein 27 n=1 Tax=Dorcoceras hygrometricum TaxID=472368 RepID=A0A2Z7BS23_9LAMI|nr:vacuolar protein sorting-associated protein 27 [Dorcoceras hygrometricum]